MAPNFDNNQTNSPFNKNSNNSLPVSDSRADQSQIPLASAQLTQQSPVISQPLNINNNGIEIEKEGNFAKPVNNLPSFPDKIEDPALSASYAEQSFANPPHQESGGSVVIEPLEAKHADPNQYLISQIKDDIAKTEQLNSQMPANDNQALTQKNFKTEYFNEKQNIHEHKPSIMSAVIKIIIILLLPLTVATGVGIYFYRQKAIENYNIEKEVLLSVAMKNVNWQDLGNVFEPVITLAVKTQNSYNDWEFLIDSGAVISSLPNDWAAKTGQDLAFLKRSTFRGFGGTTSLAYQGVMTISIGDEEKTFPVVFTESSGTKSLLGRKGFFEEYSVYFNHNDKRIEIRK